MYYGKNYNDYSMSYEDYDDSNIRCDNIFEIADEIMLDAILEDEYCIQFAKSSLVKLNKALVERDDPKVCSLMRTFLKVIDLERTENCQRALECTALLIEYTKQMIE